MIALLLLWLCILITANAASTLRIQTLPTGVARVYGYAWYTESGGKIGYIRRARVELWEDTLVDKLLAISQTNDKGYYEFNIAMTGSKNVYAKIFCESYIVSVTYGIFDSVYSYETPTRVVSEGSTTDLYSVP